MLLRERIRGLPGILVLLPRFASPHRRFSAQSRRGEWVSAKAVCATRLAISRLRERGNSAAMRDEMSHSRARIRFPDESLRFLPLEDAMRRSDYRNALKFRLAALDRAIALARLHYRFASNAEKVVCVGELEDLAWRREQCLERLRRLEQERKAPVGWSSDPGSVRCAMHSRIG